jgi:hypothetical protein
MIHGALGDTVSTAGFAVFQSAVVWDVFGCLYCYFFHNDEALEGMLWSSLTMFSIIACSIRIADIKRDITEHVTKGGAVDTSGTQAPIICAISVTIALLSAVSISCMSHHIDTDLFVPFISFAFLLTKRGLLVEDRHPLHLIVVSSITWWFARTIYQMFFKDILYPSEIDRFDGTDAVFFGLIHDMNLSIHRYDTPWFPWIHIGNLIMAILALASTVLCFISSIRSEQTVFALALVNGIVIIASNSICIRFMGCASTIYCAWMCYTIGNIKSTGNRLI